MPINFATVHIDGALDYLSLQLGVSRGSPDMPAAKALILAGKQKHPIWAFGRLAIVMYSYATVAQKHNPKRFEPLQLNLTGMLASTEQGSCVIAHSVTWHTSDAIRGEAERMITELAGKKQSALRWPSEVLILMPIAQHDIQTDEDDILFVKEDS
jgi:hypothetical protein